MYSVFWDIENKVFGLNVLIQCSCESFEFNNLYLRYYDYFDYGGKMDCNLIMQQNYVIFFFNLVRVKRILTYLKIVGMMTNDRA